MSTGPEGRVVLRLTEVEAYGGSEDPASHAFRGFTRRNASMFGPPGYAYVYLVYGMHWCLNVVTGPVGTPGAVLFRAGEVLEGQDIVRLRRPAASDRNRARGPANLAKALQVTGALDGVDLCTPAGPLQLRLGQAVPKDQLGSGPRVGVSGAGALACWRFFLAGEPTVSGPRRRHTG